MADTLQADQTLLAATFELAIPMALAGGGMAASYVTMQYGLWKEYQGRAKGTQALYV
jgi:hypothetical protein